MLRYAHASPASLAVLVLLAVSGCESSVAPEPTVGFEVLHSPIGPSATASWTGSTSEDAAVSRQLAELRRATDRFHRVEAAEEAGYTVLVTHPTTGAACLEDVNVGGMGRHLLNPGLVDDVVSIPEPEVVIYEPMRDGKLRLVGVEYIIPWSILGPDEPAPVLFGRAFLPNETFGLWMLHVYAWKHNPDGTFATWNPAVSCQYDGAVDE
ncbi:MAG: hypothetical protein ACYC6F_17650 [Longimicrobiales bacterium]